MRIVKRKTLSFFSLESAIKSAYLLWLTILFCRLLSLSIDTAEAQSTFEIQLFDATVQLHAPYTLISGKKYRLSTVSSDGTPVAARWFLSGNLGRIVQNPLDVSGRDVHLEAVFVGEGRLIATAASVEKSVSIKVVSAFQTIGIEGGTFRSPAGIELSFPPHAVLKTSRIQAEIVAPPAPHLSAQRLVHVIRLSPDRLVLKRPAQLRFLYPKQLHTAPFNIYFWEKFQRRWVPLSGDVNPFDGTVTTSINHLGIYTLMASEIERKRSTRLKIQEVTLSPRVFFAPEQHRLTIAYHLNAPDTHRALVTMDIFNLHNRRIRRLLNNVSRYIGPNAEQWDGLTDSGTLVRNGRYLLIIHAKAGSQNTVARKLIIVFK